MTKDGLWIAHLAKFKDLMTDLELPSHCVDIRDFDVNRLADRFASISNAEEIKSHLAASLAK